MSHDLLFNPSQITKFISPSPDNVNFTTIPKPQNAFILYRKNYAAKHKSLGDHKDWKILSKEASVAWKNESDKVKNYYKMLTKLAREKHDKKSNTLGNQLPKEYTFIDQQPELQQKIEDNNNNNNCKFSTSPYLCPSSSSCKNDNSNSSSSAIFLPCSISCDNALPINYDNNIINKTNAILQSARFNDLNGKNLLEGFQQYLQTEQTDAQLYENCLDLLDFCHKELKYEKMQNSNSK
ncbi:8744_t:CDS:1 [Entrophospora sp. SA101]|nr:8744_t:CDS:1 [Entrophospora sp. SA101]CAJ0849331.1 12592_t:CDS:1 [Entrophospora sp. SA101]